MIRRKATRLLHGAVTRLMAGLSLSDLAGMARGDPPPRPDPRLSAHTRSFWLHIRPRYYHEAATRFTHTFRLGLLATILGIIEAVTGVFLMLYYTPAPDRAYGDVVRLVSQIPFGQLARDLHRLAAEGLVAVAVLHLVRTFITGSYKHPRRFTWVTGVFLLVAVLFLSFSGYLLPWDQLAYWAVTIGTSLADKIPPESLGSGLKELLLGGPEVGADALLRFYMLHVLLVPLAGAILFAVHYFKVVRAGISLPASEEEAGQDTARRVPRPRRRYTIPDILVDEIVFVEVVALILLGIIILGVYPGAALGHHADPMRTPLGAAAPWYFLWVQGLLKLGDPVLMGVIVPLGFLVFMLLLPYLDANPSRRVQDRRVALGVSAAVVLAFALLMWLGRPSSGVYLAPAEAVVQHILPEESRGPLRSLPWAAIQVGEWDTRTVDLSTAGPELRSVMTAISQRIADEDARARRRGGEGLPEGRAKLVISLWQADLKKVALRLFWQGAGGEQQVFERSFFIHRAAGGAGE